MAKRAIELKRAPELPVALVAFRGAHRADRIRNKRAIDAERIRNDLESRTRFEVLTLLTTVRTRLRRKMREDRRDECCERGVSALGFRSGLD